jgi:hypothetical protein
MVKLINPFRQRVCPYCGKGFHPGNCAITSSITRKEIRKANSSFLSRAFVQPIKGQKYIRELALRQCPNSDCGELLPYNIERADSYTIAIVGDSSSGKSHYIASCIRLLKERDTLQIIGCSSLIGLGDTDENYRKNYSDYIYKQKIRIPPNQPGIVSEPLIYELVFRQKSFLQPARSVNLLFYDSSGEDMVQQYRMVQYSQFVLNASAIIFLADPLAMPHMVDVLPAHLKPATTREDSASEVLNRIMHTFVLGKGVTPGTQVKTPVAITVSKSDLLKFVVKGGPQPLFLKDSSFPLDTREFEFINEEIRYYLQKYGDKVLVRAAELFANSNFFAVSATGFPSDETTGKFPAIEPLRCLDPLLWALLKIGVISPE